MDQQNPETLILPYGAAAIDAAAALVRGGWPVALPTETVYGLAADAGSDAAVARIYAAKGRPAFNPLIVHVLDVEEAERLADLTAGARTLAEAFWPGPVTLVVPVKRGSRLAAAVTAGLPTVALRCPAHPAMRDLLRAGGRPLAAPSANASGAISPTRAEHVLKTLGGRIRLIVDGGETAHGLESTIVGFPDGGIALLRAGPVPFDMLARIAGLPTSEAGEGIQAPGQLSSHYAPSKPVRLNVRQPEADEWMIGFGSVPGDDTLSAAGDLAEAAARLFGALHRAEAAPAARIAVAPVPITGVGLAINDRLRRAAAPKG
ncbi:L-threonylcarbamoyladenylate synthase [Sphingosinicella sp. BN140058]|uniref:L-threonylcarbamoyladenylate synthase n=1 Tax=Sphingosinicella sp. BN140058 TaxID=1892855 RepID=UPI0010101E71|nr:L-threonylcarbamoyladenylate synthase [Sphingosinicella sp. BN140058]QAY76081.1 threonylcarbamoyl-AMP synthase [Sphingosinicella sp. BN140058]